MSHHYSHMDDSYLDAYASDNAKDRQRQLVLDTNTERGQWRCDNLPRLLKQGDQPTERIERSPTTLVDAHMRTSGLMKPTNKDCGGATARC